jgi:L-rhamnose mutarotase
MKRLALKMKLIPVFATDCEKRHNEIWPEPMRQLYDTGTRDFSIPMDKKIYVQAVLQNI